MSEQVERLGVAASKSRLQPKGCVLELLGSYQETTPTYEAKPSWVAQESYSSLVRFQPLEPLLQSLRNPSRPNCCIWRTWPSS